MHVARIWRQRSAWRALPRLASASPHSLNACLARTQNKKEEAAIKAKAAANPRRY